MLFYIFWHGKDMYEYMDDYDYDYDMYGEYSDSRPVFSNVQPRSIQVWNRSGSYFMDPDPTLNKSRIPIRRIRLF